MTELIAYREIDKIIYNDFKNTEFWQNIIKILSMCGIKTVVDLGASSGLSTLWLLDGLPNIELVYCFEPDDENYRMLLTNLERFGDKIVPFNYGIYYGMSESEVFGIGDNSPLGYCVKTIKDRTVTSHQFTQYAGKIFYLKELEEMVDFIPDLIKIDVEGSEYNIIENSTLLKKARYLLIAFHNQFIPYVQDIIQTNLKDYNLISCWGSDVYYDILFERKEEWQESSS